jgi:K+-sensing histidine kinase KdpD
LQVTHQGPGFPPADRARPIAPYPRADEARDTSTGTAGLGLSIARGIVTAHDGTVGLGDGPGGVVVISLPL